MRLKKEGTALNSSAILTFNYLSNFLFPRKTDIMALSIKNEFEQGRIKHLLFKSKLRAILLGAKIDETPVLSEHECPFGQWMQDFLLRTYSGSVELSELERLHTDMHRVARRLVKLHHAGAEDTAMKGVPEAEEMADRIMELLDRLEAKSRN